MGSEYINIDQRKNLAVITLNRSDTHNVLSLAMVKELGETLQSCSSPDVRAVLITGEGNTFCPGADVKEFARQLEEEGPEGLSLLLEELATTLHRDVIASIRRLDKPVIAAVNGIAAGAGFSLMLACDIRIASANARFLPGYATIGGTAYGGSTYLLSQLVGIGKAMEIFVAGQPLSAECALEMGLVSQVCQPNALHRHAMETTVRLSEGPTLAYARTKQLLDQAWGSELERQLDSEAATFASIGLTQDFQEGIRAFTQKRRAVFHGN